ncbi:acyloxyacyl hydrolase [Telmatobacter sp. DSM 110680]|uniref:Acyloxyacyl hydrolase n=1 Tax=Telmatobacter sp. DSM 110680 TaxID=3036704 RepID=A0AAU7DN20_9BACT
MIGDRASARYPIYLMLAILLLCKSAFGQGTVDQPVTSAPPDDSVNPGQSAHPKLPDFNEDIYYKNRLEFSLETGFLPINIPFVYNFITGDSYTRRPLNYTLIPNVASIRWELGNIDGGPRILRGNTDFSFSGSYTDIARGPETRYFAFDFGIRHNFVPRRWRVAPYFDMRGGVGDINAKGPDGVLYAQGEDLTFTYMMGAGARYNFNPKFSLAAGANYMHVSNASLSAPKVVNYGINVWGAMFGFYMRLGRAKPRSEAK